MNVRCIQSIHQRVHPHLWMLAFWWIAADSSLGIGYHEALEEDWTSDERVLAWEPKHIRKDDDHEER